MRPLHLLIALLLFSSMASAQQSFRVQAGPSDRPQYTQFRDFLATGLPCPYCPEMTTLPTGRFRMGSPLDMGHAAEHARGDGRFTVTMTAALSVSLSEITRAQYNVFMQANPQLEIEASCGGVIDGQFSQGHRRSWASPGFSQGENHPVVCVTWSMANKYVAWLSRITGQHYRLLSEAEWEYAARSGSDFDYWWGDALLPNRANCGQMMCGEEFTFTSPVRSFGANLFGLFDMHGNVWEWTDDCYDAKAYRRAKRPYPMPVTGSQDCKRVIRGGSWSDNFWVLRSANREGWQPGRAWIDIGFRVARVGRRVPL